MKKTLLMSLVLAATAFALSAATAPGREFRSAWVSTAWALDWPSNTGSSATVATRQKAEIDRLVDSLSNCNFNAVAFQVRSMCDAMYHSSYEPWSSYLTGSRGTVPTYDPLQYFVEACHRRGMECHAWVNPYRFSSNGIDQWKTAQDQALKESGLLLSAGNYVILDPAKQESIDRIVNVCREIITGYDVDGLVFDDYFYPDGITSDASAGDYSEWQQSGTTMTLADWRRDNVNRMVAAVYQMIQTAKPEIRFGISPAGVAASNSTVAAKYGVDPCPSGSDWQYNGIFSDPLAWLSQHTIDYISPQVYWRIGSSSDYGKITPWWGQVAHKFGRHVYISHSISDLNSKSGESAHRTFMNEVLVNRESNLDAAPGSMFFRAMYLYRIGSEEELASYFHRTVYTTPVLPPAMPWKPGTDPGTVTALQRSGHTLTWQGFDNYKYGIYVRPNSDPEAPAQLVRVSYTTTFAIPEAQRYGYTFAVAPIDRINNEFTPVEETVTATQTLPAPQLVDPEEGALVPDPFVMSWLPVEGAQGYMVEIATDEAITQNVQRFSTSATSLNSLAMGELMHNRYYWRVRACAEGMLDGVSAVRSCAPQRFTITYPLNGAEGVNPSFTATWLTGGSDATATVEISTSADFSAASIVVSGTSATGSFAVEPFQLACGNVYYMRVRMTVDGVEKITTYSRFLTAYLVAQAPAFAHPVDGGILYSDQPLVMQRQEAASTYTVEISTSPTTWGRNRYIETLRDFNYQTTKTGAEIKVNGKLLVDGTTYYARARAGYIGESGAVLPTDYCAPIAFTYNSGTAPLLQQGDVDGNGVINGSDVTTLYNHLLSGATCVGDPDVDGNGVVNGSDVTTLYSILLQ